MAEETTDTSGQENVDELLASIEAPSAERPMSAPEAETPAVPQWDGKQWEFEWGGKKVFPDSQEKAKTWMSQGYNYSQRMGEFNKSKAAWESERQKFQQELDAERKKLSPYSKVDEYARNNPDWWKHVLAQYEQQQRAGQPQLDPNLQGVIRPLEEKLGKFEQYFQQMEQQKLEAQLKQEDQALDQDVQSIRKEFPNIDFDAPDPETGKPLEKRILEHASEMFGHLPAYKPGVFKAAFRDYLHDQLIEQAKASGREAVAKDAQANAKKGILGKTPAPVKGIKPAQSVKGKSYGDLLEEAKREYGIA